MKITSFPSMEEVRKIALEYLSEDYESGEISSITNEFITPDLLRITEEHLVNSGLAEALQDYSGFLELKKFTENYFENNSDLGSSLFYTINCLEDLEISKAPYACFAVAVLSMAEEEVFTSGRENISSDALRLFERSIALLWSLLGQLLEAKPKNREETLYLCRIVDSLSQEIEILKTLAIYSDNAEYLTSLDEWFEEVTDSAEKFLLPSDYEELSESTHFETLSAMHAKNVDFAWVESILAEDPFTFLTNNSHIPREIVNRFLRDPKFDKLKLVLHPNADPELAVQVILELLNNGEDIDVLRPWDNFRDDGFNNYNSFSSGAVYPKVIQAISDWCDEDPEARESTREFLESYSF